MCSIAEIILYRYFNTSALVVTDITVKIDQCYSLADKGSATKALNSSSAHIKVKQKTKKISRPKLPSLFDV